MQLHINGELREIQREALPLSELIETLSLTPQRIAVEVNKTIVRRSVWSETILKDGDRIEIVHFVGGGTGGGKSSLRRLVLSFSGLTWR